MRIKNIILDIGNVICRWDSAALVRGVFADPVRAQQAHQATIGHPDWLDLDRGTITLADAIARAQQRSGLDPDKIALIYHNTPKCLVPVESTVAVIRDLHARGVPLYVLSNMHDHSWQYLVNTYDFWSCFAGVVVSCDINLIKPDPAIYQFILKTYDLEPGVTAFIDDMPENIEAAREAGIVGAVLEDPDKGYNVINDLIK